MGMKSIMAPTNDWPEIKKSFKLLGEKEGHPDPEDLVFLECLGLIKAKELTSQGKNLFDSIFIRPDITEEKKILRKLLLAQKQTMVMQQYFWGMKAVSLEQVRSALKIANSCAGVTQKSFTHFLGLLNYCDIIIYNRKKKTVKILASPSDNKSLPSSVFISPDRPFTNISSIKKVLGDCEGYIYWFDKHFQKEALEWICEVADAGKIKEIKILSLDLGQANLNSNARKMFGRLKAELAQKEINLSWATIESEKVKDVHDRWIIGQNHYLRNIPDVNSICSGKNSELNLSQNYDEVIKIFCRYWKESKEI